LFLALVGCGKQGVGERCQLPDVGDCQDGLVCSVSTMTCTPAGATFDAAPEVTVDAPPAVDAPAALPDTPPTPDAPAAADAPDQPDAG
jgi:hypothetical protein